MEDKKALRLSMKETLKNLDSDMKAKWIKQIHERLFSLEAWNNAKTIAVTISFGFELDTHKIIQYAIEQGKIVAVPKCHPKDKRLEFRAITSFHDLETVYYGILEPKVNETRPIKKEEIDLIIVPGLIFSKEGYRVGFGGGYYDRFLKDVDVLKVSQALDIQFHDSLPHEIYDVPVDLILTPSRLIECEKI